MSKGDRIDPRGLIFESYRIEGISAEQCRSIFMDWALGVPQGQDPVPLIRALLDRHAQGHEDHPMTKVLRAGLEPPSATGRRGGRARRRPN